MMASPGSCETEFPTDSLLVNLPPLTTDNMAYRLLREDWGFVESEVEKMCAQPMTQAELHAMLTAWAAERNVQFLKKVFSM